MNCKDVYERTMVCALFIATIFMLIYLAFKICEMRIQVNKDYRGSIIEFHE